MTLALALGPAASEAAPERKAPTAEQKETARSLMQIGDEKLAAGDEAGALDAYEDADAIMGVPTTSLAVGRARARLGMLVEAIDALQRVIRYPERAGEPAAFARARAAAKQLDADLARRVPTVRVRVRGPAQDTPVEVKIDGAPVPANAKEVPRRVNPGEHVVSASAPGYFPAERPVRVAEQEHIEVELELEPGATPEIPEPGGEPAAREEIPAADSEAPAAVMIAGFTVGGLGLALGAATGAASLAMTSDLEERCGGTRCPAGEEGEHDTIIALANTSNVAFAVGAAGVAVGIVGLALELGVDDADEGAGLRPMVGPLGGGLSGAF